MSNQTYQIHEDLHAIARRFYRSDCAGEDGWFDLTISRSCIALTGDMYELVLDFRSCKESVSQVIATIANPDMTAERIYETILHEGQRQTVLCEDKVKDRIKIAGSACPDDEYDEHFAWRVCDELEESIRQELFFFGDVDAYICHIRKPCPHQMAKIALIKQGCELINQEYKDIHSMVLRAGGGRDVAA